MNRAAQQPSDWHSTGSSLSHIAKCKMAKIEYSLFRAKMIRPNQSSFLHDNRSAGELLDAAFQERPSAVLSKGQTWHVGNIRYFSEQRGYFKFGRTTRIVNTKFDQRKSEFVEEDFDTSPFTHVVCDSSIGILGIAQNHRLARSARGIANRLQALLAHTDTVRENEIEVLIDAISDPKGFIETMKSAYRVLRFTANFTGPNPFDADQLFQKPLSVYLSEANGEKGKATVEGDRLNKAVLADVARSTAATGNNASARIRPTANQSPITIGLRSCPELRD